MNIQTIRDNLKNTIAGKELLVGKKRQELEDGDCYSDPAHEAVIRFLKVNIAELKRVLQDVEQCIPKNIYNDMDPGRDSLDGPMIKMFRED